MEHLVYVLGFLDEVSKQALQERLHGFDILERPYRYSILLGWNEASFWEKELQPMLGLHQIKLHFKDVQILKNGSLSLRFEAVFCRRVFSHTIKYPYMRLSMTEDNSEFKALIEKRMQGFTANIDRVCITALVKMEWWALKMSEQPYRLVRSACLNNEKKTYIYDLFYKRQKVGDLKLYVIEKDWLHLECLYIDQTLLYHLCQHLKENKISRLSVTCPCDKEELADLYESYGFELLSEWCDGEECVMCYVLDF